MNRVLLCMVFFMAIFTAAMMLYAGIEPENIDKSTSRKSIATETRLSQLALSTQPLSTPVAILTSPAPKYFARQLAAASAVPHKMTAVPTAVASEASQHRLIDPTAGVEFLPVPGGCFQMGDSAGDTDEYPAHQVCLESFFVGKYEVTQGQWLRIMGNHPFFFSSCGNDCPVENVSWNEVQEFIIKLNRLSSTNYRLLTEAEWEYACRGGNQSDRFCGGADADAVAWYDRNSNSKPHRVGEKLPNGFGVYDMSGNVWEWVGDLYQKDYYSGPQLKNPKGPLTGSTRVMRGGSWYNDFKNVRASIRGSDDPEHRSINLGFRLAYSNQSKE